MFFCLTFIISELRNLDLTPRKGLRKSGRNLLAPEQVGDTMGSVSIRGIYVFYRDGFRAMTLGRVLWGIILVKLVIIFAVLRVFFFTPHLRGTDEEKAGLCPQS